MKDITNVGVLIKTSDKKEIKDAVNKFIAMKLVCQDCDEISLDSFLTSNDPINYKVVYSDKELFVYGNKMIVTSLLNIFKETSDKAEVSMDLYFKMVDAELLDYFVEMVNDNDIIKKTEIALDKNYVKTRDMIPMRLNDVSGLDGYNFLYQYMNGSIELLYGKPVMEIMNDNMVLIMHHLHAKTKIAAAVKGANAMLDYMYELKTIFSEASNMNNADMNSNAVKKSYLKYSQAFANFESFSTYLPIYEQNNDVKIKVLIDAEEIMEGSYLAGQIPVEKLYRLLVPNKMSCIINYDSDKSQLELAQVKGTVRAIDGVCVYDSSIDKAEISNCTVTDVTVNDCDVKNCILSNDDITNSYIENSTITASTSVKESELNICNIYGSVAKSEIKASVIYIQADIDTDSKIINSTKF